MSTEEPTAPEESSTTKASPEEDWNVLEGRTGSTAIEDEKPAPSQSETKRKEQRGKRVLSRHRRLVVGAGLAVLVVSLASFAVAAWLGGDHARRSRPRSGAVHAKRQEAPRRRSGRVRWVREAGESPRPRQGRTALRRPCARRHARPRRKPRRPAHREAELPTQPPEPAPPEQPPEPSAPAPAAPSAPKERPGLRDGATESSEFGL